MTGITLVADKNTATCFKLAGFSMVYSAENAQEAEKCLQRLMGENNLRIVLVSERLLRQIQIFEKISERQYPLVIPIPDIKGPETLKTNLIVELIKRKTGIEVKVGD